MTGDTTGPDTLARFGVDAEKLEAAAGDLVRASVEVAYLMVRALVRAELARLAVDAQKTQDEKDLAAVEYLAASKERLQGVDPFPAETTQGGCVVPFPTQPGCGGSPPPTDSAS